MTQFISEGEKMKFVRIAQKGEANAYYILWGVVIALLVVFGVKYHNDHRDDVVIHPPHIEVH
jgi:hypothetical protein